ncbi:MAG TPA: hypothetical protein VMB51_01335 [Solirubrobacteraceae bacterium]|nr:hypothetical protein [Solirubrobacteraceae bacterium]
MQRQSAIKRLSLLTVAGLMAFALSSWMAAASASAHKTSSAGKTPDQAQADEAGSAGSCVIHTLPSFMDEGYGSEASSVADIIEIECEPVFAEQTVKVGSQELYSRCADHLSWSAVSNEADPYNPVEGASIGNVQLDDDGNAIVAVWGGPSCAAGESLVSAHLEEAPYTSVTTSFTVLPPKPTTPGVWALPSSQVEAGDYSNSATIVQVEFPPAYAERNVVISDEQLYAHCEGHLYWIGPDEQPIGVGEAAAVKLDDDGNAFVVLLGGPSCAAGATEVETSLEKAPYTTYTSGFSVGPPEPTWEEPSFTIEKLQEIKGSDEGFTKEPLMGKLGQTVDYEMIVKNTGNVALTLSDFIDAHCDPGTIAGGPGSSPLEPDESTTYTCDHVLNTYGTYTNEATVTGTPPSGMTITHTSNQVVVTVLEPGFKIEKLQEIRGSGMGFTKEKLMGEVGQTVDYEIVVTNTGQVPLTFSDFTDPHCDPGTIEGGPGSSPVVPGASTTYTCSHALTEAGIYTNVAEVTGTPEGETPIKHESNVVEVEVPTTPPVEEPAFTIEKFQRIDGGSFTTEKLIGMVGETVEYEIIVKNTGNVPLTFSNFEDSKCDPGTIAGGPGSSPVAPGSSTTYTCNHVLTQAGTYTNAATVTGTPEGETPIEHESNVVEVEAKTTPPLEEPAFTIEKLQRIGASSSFTKEPLTGSIGQTVEYEIVVKNTGNVPLTFSNFEDSKCDAGTITGGPGSNPVGVGEATVYRCTHLLTGAGEYTNVAIITGTPEGGSPMEPQGSNVVAVTVPEEPKKEEPPKNEEKPASSSTTPSTTTPGTTPKHEVSPACVASAPKLKGVTGPKSGSFTVSVPSQGIKQITFYLDNHKIKTMKQSQAKHGKFTIKVNTSKLHYGPHRVSFKAIPSNSDCVPLARSSQFVHTASSRKAPKFTG